MRLHTHKYIRHGGERLVNAVKSTSVTFENNLLRLGPATAHGIAAAPLAPRAPAQGLIAQGTSPVHFVALAHAAGCRNGALCIALLLGLGVGEELG